MLKDDQAFIVASRTIKEILERFDKKIKDPRRPSKGRNISKIIKEFLNIKCPINNAAKVLNKFSKKYKINWLVDKRYFPISKNKINQLYDLYIKTIDEIIKEGQWPQDQFVFTKMYCKKYNYIQKVRSMEHPFVENNGWFYMIPYFF